MTLVHFSGSFPFYVSGLKENWSKKASFPSFTSQRVADICCEPTITKPKKWEYPNYFKPNFFLKYSCYKSQVRIIAKTRFYMSNTSKKKLKQTWFLDFSSPLIPQMVLARELTANVANLPLSSYLEAAPLMTIDYQFFCRSIYSAINWWRNLNLEK